jgi:hypothetical protein
VSFTAITLCAASQRVFVVLVVYFVIDSVRKLLHIPSYTFMAWSFFKQWIRPHGMVLN